MTDNMLLLLRRAGFGPTAAELAAAKERGYQASIEHRVAPSGPDLGAGRAPFPSLPVDPYTRFPPPPARGGGARGRCRARGINHACHVVVAGPDDHRRSAGSEEVGLFLAWPLATSAKKVRDARLFRKQYQLLRYENFVEMARGMVQDPAMI
jgi:hypothetical protein